MDPSTETIICEVTGKEIARDNAIQFQGKWVGAEGKAILLERLRSGVDESDSLVPASVVLRIAGYLVDTLLYLVIFAAIGLPTGLWIVNLKTDVSADDPSRKMTLAQVVFELVMNTLFILYVAIMQWRFGRTVGKFVSGTKVVCLDGSTLSMQRAFGRALCSDDLTIVISIAMLVMVLIELSDSVSAPGLQDRFQWILTCMSAVVSVLALVSIFMALIDSRLRRALHDRLAGTRVVRVL